VVGSTPMSFWDYLVLLLRQFSGGPGPVENNLMRFGLPAVMWALLLSLAVARQRQGESPRERWLILGFGLGFIREAYMFLHVSDRIITGTHHAPLPGMTMEPLEHAIAVLSLAVVAGSFIGYCLQLRRLSIGYILAAIGVTLVSYAVTAPWWASFTLDNPSVTFHSTWGAWAFHAPSFTLMVIAIVLLLRTRGWLRNTVVSALGLYLLSEGIMLVNFATDKAHSLTLCPLSNALHILSIPVFGYVYLREQTAEKRRAEAQLSAYQNHLEELVTSRTRELTETNKQLVHEVNVRAEAERALARLSRQHALILDSAGEGIFGVDLEGRHTFVNPTAATLLGYEPEELIGEPSHSTWHHSYPDGSPYPEDACPLHLGYRTGEFQQGSDQVLWRKDGTSFPARYMSTPIYEANGDDGEPALVGAVVTFADVTEQHQAALEITRRNSELAVQNAMADTISQSLELGTLLTSSLETVLNEMNVRAGCVFLYEGRGETLYLEVCRQVSADSVTWSGESWAQAPCLDLARDAIAERRPLTLSLEELTGGAAQLPWDGAGRLIAVPLVAKGRPVGVMALATRTGADGPTENLDLLTAIGQQVGIAVDNARLYLETQARAAELALLHDASVKINTTLGTGEVYTQIVEQALRLLDCREAMVFQRQSGTDMPRSILSSGLTPDQAAALADEEHVVAAWLAELIRSGRTITVADTGAKSALGDPGLTALWHDRMGITTLLGRPLLGTQAPLGYILFADNRGPKTWNRSEQELAESFVNLSAIVIEKAQLQERAERAAALEERQRIASDVHDGLAQTLSYLGHRVDELIDGAHRGDAGHVTETGDRIRAALDAASTEVRKIIASLQSQPEPKRSLQTLIQDTIDAYRRDPANGIAFSAGEAVPIFVSPAEQEQVQRVVQEALLNAQNHGSPEHIDVALTRDDGDLVITVADDGAGFDPTDAAARADSHFGLSIMRARAARLGGSLQVRSAPDQGTSVILRWPHTTDSKD